MVPIKISLNSSHNEIEKIHACYDVLNANKTLKIMHIYIHKYI